MSIVRFSRICRLMPFRQKPISSWAKYSSWTSTSKPILSRNSSNNEVKMNDFNFISCLIPSKVKFYSQETGTKSTQYFDDITSKNKVVIFMKGTPSSPKCGFSNAVVQILRMHGVESYDSYDVLEDEGIRQGIKVYSDWPTIPQIYLNKEFIGGCDILIQMHQNGDLIEELQKIGITSALLKQSNEESETKPT